MQNKEKNFKKSLKYLKRAEKLEFMEYLLKSIVKTNYSPLILRYSKSKILSKLLGKLHQERKNALSKRFNPCKSLKKRTNQIIIYHIEIRVKATDLN
jgi:hypothetical protein